MNNILIILNPKAGKLRARGRLFDIVEPFCKVSDNVRIAITQYRGHAEQLARESDADLIVCVGGDGTLNETVNGVLSSGKDCPIGYIPAGSTNDFAGTLGLSKNIETAVADIVLGQPFTIDVGKFGQRYFSYVASFGVFTRSSYATDQNLKNVLGHLAYVLEGAKELTNIKTYAMDISADGEDHSGEYVFGAILNTTSMGGIIKLNKKKVKLDDGLFEVLLVRQPQNEVETLQTIQAITNNTFDAPTIEFFTAKHLVFHQQEELDWSLDGEQMSSTHTIAIENIPRAVQIMLREK